MATATDHRRLAVAGPLAALVAAWLTTAGHTANFREMSASRGWITSVSYGLHSGYLFSIALTVLAFPLFPRLLPSAALARLGLILLASGSFLNGIDLHAPYVLALFGRVLAGAGAGLVLCAGPRLLPGGRSPVTDWFGIVLPAFGPLTIAGASITYGWSSWEGGFLFEGVLALFGLAALVAAGPAPEPATPPHSPLWYWPALVVGIGCVWYLLQWGHLSGWAGDRIVILVGFAGAVALTAALWLAWPELDPAAVPRGLLIGYAGAVQFFLVSETGVFGGLFVNVSDWLRAFQIWPLGIGAAVAVAASRVLRLTPTRGDAIAGLLVLAAGMGLAYETMIGWPFWDVLNPVEFHWFAAPQAWEFAPARFLIGFGHGYVIASEARRAHPDPAREARARPVLQAAQFVGGGVGIGVLSTVLLAGHQWEYSYAADRGSIQAAEVAARTDTLREAYAAAGDADPGRRADVLMFRSVNYQADALVFAGIYAGFGVTSLAAAVLVAGWVVVSPGPRRFGEAFGPDASPKRR
jgi:hypothetical protein